MDDRRRPAGIWILAIVASGLGVLGACGGLYQLGTAALQGPMLAATERAEERELDAAPSRALALEMQRRSLEVARAFRVPKIVAEAANLLVSFVLLVAAILLLTWHPNAVGIMNVVVALSALIDLANGGLAIAIGLETTRVIAEAVSASGGGPEGGRMGSVLAASGSVGVCFTVGWALAKLGFYAGAVLYLRREPVRSLFA